MSTHPTYVSPSEPRSLFLRNEYEFTVGQACLEFDEGYFNALISMYRDPARIYHNEAHIAKVLERVKHLGHLVEADDYIAVKFAAFYHDCVYVPGWAWNELQSSRVALTHLQTMGYKDAYLVAALIEATRDHQPRLKSSEKTAPYGLICDADLYELGTDRYWENGVLIWHEFGQPDDELWRFGRRKFLESYLDRAKIFHLPGQEELEKTARKFMQYELLSLGGCPNDTDGDGDCGKKYCPFCGSNR
jgi:predicted metal-dependent HD superfamily phosphohydrolase